MSFEGDVKSFFANVRVAAQEAAVGLAQTAFHQIVETGPQYSGDFVRNTKVSVGKVDRSFKQSETVGVPKQMGDPEAIGDAERAAVWAVPTLGQSIFISSTATHDEPYAWKIENGEIAFREVNRGASRIYGRAAEYTARRYKAIGPVQLDGLRKLKL